MLKTLASGTMWSFINALVMTVLLMAGYFVMIALAAWQSPADLHPPITEGWASEALTADRALYDAVVAPEIEAIMDDDSQSAITQLSRVNDVQMAFNSLRVPPKKPFFESIAFAWNVIISTSVAGGAWKALAIFVCVFFWGIKETACECRKGRLVSA